MKAIAAKEAKDHFGEMLDTVQREPISIEKHGRAVAVIMSAHAYQQMKIERLRTYLAVGEAQADRGEFSAKTAEDIIKEGTQRYHARKI